MSGDNLNVISWDESHRIKFVIKIISKCLMTCQQRNNESTELFTPKTDYNVEKT
jgi:hypothetical protein